MTLLQRLEALAKKKDWECRKNLVYGGSYNFALSDERDVLQEAAKSIAFYEAEIKEANRLLAWHS